MKYAIRMIAMMIALALLAGCGSLPFELPFGQSSGSAQESAAEVAAEPETEAEETPASFGVNEITETPELQAEVTAAVEITPEPEVSEQPVEEPETEEPVQDLKAAQVKSAICANYFTDVAYDPADPIYFWRAICYMTILAEDQIEGAEREETTVTEYNEEGEAVEAKAELIRIPAEALDPLVTALFGAYEEQYPALSEEDPRVAWESTEDGEFYRITIRDLDDWAVKMDETEPDEDGIYHYEVTFTDEGKAIALYRVDMKDYPEDADGADVFTFTVSDVEFLEYVEEAEEPEESEEAETEEADVAEATEKPEEPEKPEETDAAQESQVPQDAEVSEQPGTDDT